MQEQMSMMNALLVYDFIVTDLVFQKFDAVLILLNLALHLLLQQRL